jgi:hypothetical protein
MRHAPRFARSQRPDHVARSEIGAAHDVHHAQSAIDAPKVIDEREARGRDLRLVALAKGEAAHPDVQPSQGQERESPQRGLGKCKACRAEVRCRQGKPLVDAAAEEELLRGPTAELPPQGRFALFGRLEVCSGRFPATPRIR